ncbi:membrane protein, partial [Stenotrophomonas chelatiphaga]
PGSPVTSAPPALQPLNTADRITVMDILRGAALFGILLMNIEAFTGPLDLSFTGVDPHWHGIDYLADALVYVLVQGKFFLLFSLLFGAGFAVMAQRAQGAGRDFTPIYLRRSVALLLIGACHALLVWSGDILLVYALLSFLLLGTRRWPVSMLPAMGALVYAFAVGLSLLFALLVWAAARGGSPLDSAGSMRAAQEVIEAQRLAYGQGSWAQANVQRLADLRHMVGGILITGPEIFGMFLIGAWFARSGALADPARFASLYARLRWIAMPAGVVLMLASAAWHPYLAPGEFTVRTGLSYAMAAVASLLMALGYLGWIVQARHALGWLAAPGRMALTHYLLQSLLCTWLFFGYGLGFFEQLPRAWQLVFAVALFALQVGISHLWLARFRYGPMEWLWRAMTYLRWPPLRRTQQTP